MRAGMKVDYFVNLAETSYPVLPEPMLRHRLVKYVYTLVRMYECIHMYRARMHACLHTHKHTHMSMYAY